jgi:hypothetical protein
LAGMITIQLAADISGMVHYTVEKQ